MCSAFLLKVMVLPTSRDFECFKILFSCQYTRNCYHLNQCHRHPCRVQSAPPFISWKFCHSKQGFYTCKAVALLLTVPSNSSFQFVLCSYFRHKQAYNVCLFRSDSFLLVSFFFRACLCRTYIKFHSFLWLNNIPLHKYATFLLIFLF